MDDGLGISSMSLLSFEQEWALVEQVRAGNEQAQHSLLLAVLRRVRPTTVAQLCSGGQGMWRVELADVMQHAYLVLLEEVPRVIGLENVLGCLITRARECIWDYISRHRSLVLVSTHVRFSAPLVESLDSPYEGAGGQEEDTWADRLAAPASSAPAMADLTALYQAARRLPLRERRALVECYGLDEAELGVDRAALGEMNGKHRIQARYLAVKKLRKQLAAAYPQYAGEYRKAQVRPACADVYVTPEQRARLTQAYQALCARQEKVGLGVLAKAAGVSQAATVAYLYEIRGGSAA
jgi:hypothetical protein